MERTIIGLVAGAALVMLATSSFSAPQAVVGHYETQSGANDLVAFTTQLASGRDQLTLVDTKSRVVAVYHIEPASGELSLKSVRAIRWDMLMTQFNAVSPLPQEIRSLVEQQ